MLPRAVRLVFALVVAAPAALAQSELVIYKEGTRLYHRAGCPLLKDATDVVAMTRAQAESRGYKPHADCDPDLKKSAGAGAPASPPVPPVVTVYLDGSRYYHRKDCSKLEANPQNVRSESLEIAGKSHWPCPVCQPPVRRKSAEPAVPGTGRRGR
jgi:hypothetical protein